MEKINNISEYIQYINLLEDEYYVLNVTGAQAVANMRDDLSQGNFRNADTFDGISDEYIESMIRYLEISFVREGKHEQQAQLFYSTRPVFWL